jgi:hypothetical protein
LDGAIKSSKVIKSEVFVDFLHGSPPKALDVTTQRISGHFGSSPAQNSTGCEGRKPRWHVGLMTDSEKVEWVLWIIIGVGTLYCLSILILAYLFG